MDKLLGAGQMNRRVEFFEKKYTRSDSGETILDEPVSIGKRNVNRSDGVGSQDEDGQLIGVSVAIFTMRFDADIASMASRLVIRDFDGDWEVSAPFEMIGSRGRQMKLRCVRYGES